MAALCLQLCKKHNIRVQTNRKYTFYIGSGLFRFKRINVSSIGKYAYNSSKD